MFDLTLSFTGMCLLVPDGATLHVLMPDSTKHRHLAKLVYVDENNELQTEDITGMDLELLDLPGVSDTPGFDASVPAEVFNFGHPLMGSKTVSRNLLDPGTFPKELVSTRVRLTVGRHGGTYRRGGFWNFRISGARVPRRLPTAVNWVVHDVDAPVLCIQDTITKHKFILKPDATGSIRAMIVHVTDTELDAIERARDIPLHSGCPVHDDEAGHFELYYPLLNPVGELLPPKFDLLRSMVERVCPPPTGMQPSSDANGSAAAPSGEAESREAGEQDGDTSDAHTSAAARGADSKSVSHTGHSGHSTAAGGRAGSELTCMVATAPPG